MTDDFTPLQPHGSLEEFVPDVFCLSGSAAFAPGVRIPRNMVVLRHEGELTVVSSVRVDEAEQARLDALGAVRNIVKIGLHGMDDAWYLSKYPEARLWALPGVDHQPGGHAPDQRLSADSLPLPWLKLFRFEQTNKPECALVADRDGGVLLTCDSVQHWPDLDGCSFLAKGVTKAFGFQKHLPVIGPPWRKKMTPAGGSLQADFERLAALEFKHLIGGHGKPKRNAKAALAETVRASFA